jgi:hypothetical protein
LIFRGEWNELAAGEKTSVVVHWLFTPSGGGSPHKHGRVFGEVEAGTASKADGLK